MRTGPRTSSRSTATTATIPRTTTSSSTRAASATRPASTRYWPRSRTANRYPDHLMVHSLGSRTSGVDGSSEGGRINTNNLPGALVIYGVALLQVMQRQNPKTKFTIAPVQVDGTWCLQLNYEGDEPKSIPDHWHGHRVILKKVEPPPPSA